MDEDVDRKIEDGYRDEDWGLSLTLWDALETVGVVAIIVACVAMLAWSLMWE